MNSLSSHPLTLSTGAPQGCILSPWLLSLYTNYFTSHHSSATIQTTVRTELINYTPFHLYADDTQLYVSPT